MYKKLILTAVAVFAITPFCSPLLAEIESQISTLTSQGTVNTEIQPDTVKVRLYVENSGKNLSDIKDKNDKTVNTIINEIKKQLKNNESVKTVSFRVNDVYTYKDKTRVFEKYTVSNGFEVKLKDLNKISQIIKIAVDNGATRVDNLNFYIENSESTCNDLISQAAKIAKNRANVVAEAAGASILKVKSINPYCSLNSNYVHSPMRANMMAKSADSVENEAAIESIEPGTIAARASVDITYYLK